MGRLRLLVAAGVVGVSISAAAIFGGGTAAAQSSTASATTASSVGQAFGLVSGKVASSGPVKIGVMLKDTAIPFQGGVIKALKEYGKKYGYQVSIQNGNDVVATEVSIIQQYIAEHVNVIMALPSSATALVPVINEANAAHIPVIIINGKVASSAKTLCFVGVDDYTYGEKQGEAVVKAIGKKGNVAVVLGALGDPSEVGRLAGLKAVLKRYPNIHIVATQTGNWDAATELTVVQDFLSRYPKGSLQAIVTQEANAAVAKYAYTHGRKDVKFVEADFPSSVKAGIADGQIAASIDQDPFPQGQVSMEVAHEYLTGHKKDACAGGEKLLPLPIVTKSNVSKYAAAWQG